MKKTSEKNIRSKKAIRVRLFYDNQHGFTQLKNFIDKNSYKVINKHFNGIKLSSILNSLTGFTLIEMLIAMAISLIVMGGTYEVFTSQQNAFRIQDQVAEMQQNARVAMDMMTRSIRMAGYIPEKWDDDSDPATATDAPNIDVSDFDADYTPDANADDIKEMGLSTITFEADIDGDGKTDTVRYSLSGGNLVREVSEWDGTAAVLAWGASSGQQPLAENITTLSFTYLNSSSVVTATPSDVRLIQIQLIARTSREDSGFTHPDNLDGYRTRTLTANVRPRNMGL